MDRQHLFIKKGTTMIRTARKTYGSCWLMKTLIPFNLFQITRASSWRFAESDNLELSDINSTWTEYFEGRQICVNCCILAVPTKKKNEKIAFEASLFSFSFFFFRLLKLPSRDNCHLIEWFNNAHTSLANWIKTSPSWFGSTQETCERNAYCLTTATSLLVTRWTFEVLIRNRPRGDL